MSSSARPFGQLLFEFVGARAQRLVGELLQLLFQRVDRLDARADRSGCADRWRNRTTCGRHRRSSHHPSNSKRRHEPFARASFSSRRDRREVQTGGKCGAIRTYARRHRPPGVRPRHRRGSVSCQCEAAASRARQAASGFRHCQALGFRRVSAPKFGAATRRHPLSSKGPHSMAFTRLLVRCALGALAVCRAPVARRPRRTRPGFRSGGRPRQRRRHPRERPRLCRGGNRQQHSEHAAGAEARLSHHLSGRRGRCCRRPPTSRSSATVRTSSAGSHSITTGC